VAFLDAFSEANRVVGRGSHYRVQVVSGSSDRNLMSQDGFCIQAASAYRNCLRVADTLIVAGSGNSPATKEDDGLLAWVRWQASKSRRIAAISGGALVLAACGLLDGRKVTTHWQFRDLLAARYPSVAIEQDVIYVRDANLYSCAGATAGLDLALRLIEEDLGTTVATEVAHSMLLPSRRSGSADQISAALRAQAVPETPISSLLEWLPDHLQDDLSIQALARRSAMSPRNFARIFRRQVGQTPAKYVENLRLQAARFLLESSDCTIENVAFLAGFGNCETLRRLFLRRLTITPGRYRATKSAGK
jgi:transcriptional regulator GlxA family with amidase domain